MPLTRGRQSNDVYVAQRDERTARDILETSLAIDRVDQPAHAARLDQPTTLALATTQPLEPDRLADLLVTRHQAQAALDRHQQQLDATAAHLRELREGYRAIPRDLDGLHAADRREQAEIEQLRHGLGSLRNRGQSRTLQHRMDDRRQQRTALQGEHAELEPQLAAAERALDDLVDRGPDPIAHRLDDITRLLDDDRWLRYDTLTAEAWRELEQQLGPRPADTEVAARWDDLAGGALQHVALDPQRHRHAHQIAADRTEAAVQQLDYERLVQRLSRPPQIDRDHAIEGLGLSL